MASTAVASDSRWRWACYVSAAFGPSVTGLEQLWYIATVVNGALASLLLRFGLVDCPADGEAALGCILLTSLFFIPLDGFVIGLLVGGVRARWFPSTRASLRKT